jgi:hypothetical protein
LPIYEEVICYTFGDDFFLFYPKNMVKEGICGTLRDALSSDG